MSKNVQYAIKKKEVEIDYIEIFSDTDSGENLDNAQVESKEDQAS